MSMPDGLLPTSRGGIGSGIVLGVVSNIDDPDSQGRVKIKMELWGTQVESDWCPVVVPLAGNEGGTWFPPQVNDEVAIAFRLGDLQYPIVMGYLWNGNDKPPEQGKKAKQTILKTVGGHQLIFDNDDQSAKIQIKTKKGHLLELDDSSQKLKLAGQNGQTKLELEVGESGKITVECGQSSIVLTQDGNITVKGQQGLTLQGPQIKIKADATLSIEAGGQLQVKSDGILTLKGSMTKIN